MRWESTTRLRDHAPASGTCAEPVALSHFRRRIAACHHRRLAALGAAVAYTEMRLQSHAVQSSLAKAFDARHHAQFAVGSHTTGSGKSSCTDPHQATWKVAEQFE